MKKFSNLPYSDLQLILKNEKKYRLLLKKIHNFNLNPFCKLKISQTVKGIITLDEDLFGSLEGVDENYRCRFK